MPRRFGPTMTRASRSGGRAFWNCRMRSRGPQPRGPTLAVIFMEAFDCALEQLLLFGREDDLRALENWLAEKG